MTGQEPQVPGFLYFKPNYTGQVSPASIAAWGLAYAFPTSPAGSVCMGSTPSRTPGVVFAEDVRHQGHAIGMHVDRQAWRKIPGSDLYVGYWRDHKPTPRELARPLLIPGYRVRLADDQEWQVPLVRRFDTEQLASVSNLPCYMELDEDGTWRRSRVLGVHAHLWELTQPVADALLGEYVEGRTPVVDDRAIMAALVALLQANYVVGPAELSLLEAFTSEASTHAAVMAACDWATFLDWAESDEQKKSAAARRAVGSTTSAGATA